MSCARHSMQIDPVLILLPRPGVQPDFVPTIQPLGDKPLKALRPYRPD